MNKAWRIILLIVICGLTFVFIWFFDKHTRLENIEVTGGTHYTAEQIRELVVNDSLDSFTYLLYLRKQVFGSVDPIPFVEKIDIEVVDRNSVVIRVYDKSVIGCVKHMGKYLHFDREGIVVESSSERMDGVPEITGIDFDSVVLGEKLTVGDNTIFNRIMELGLLLKKHELSCEEINFDLRNNVKIYFDGNIASLGAGSIFDEQLGCLKKLVDASGGKKYDFDLKNYNPAVGEVTARLIEDTADNKMEEETETGNASETDN